MSDGEDRLEIADEDHENDVAMHTYDPIDIDGNSSDEEVDDVVNIVQQQAKALKKFGQGAVVVLLASCSLLHHYDCRTDSGRAYRPHAS